MRKDVIILSGKIIKSKKEGFVLFEPSNSMCETQYVKMSSSLKDVPFDIENISGVFSFVGKIGMNSFKQPCQFFAPAELIGFDLGK